MRKFTFLIALLFLVSANVSAQGVLGGIIRDKVRDKVIEKATQEKDEDEEVESEEPETTESDVEASDATTQTKPSKQKLEAKSQYDFVPGDRILFFDDFSQDAIGDFPALWTGTGSGEVKTVNLAPGNWFHLTADDQVYNLAKDLNLPENFIFEFDLIPASVEEDDSYDFYLTLYNSSNDFMDDDLYPGTRGVHISIYPEEWQVRGYDSEKDSRDGQSTLSPVVPETPTHVIVWVQKARLRIYHEGAKVIDMPTLMYTPTNFNRLRYSMWSCHGNPLISNIRFTTASPDTRSKLLTEGKLISYGIYFDVNSDKIKPESKGAVGDIAKVLNENPQVRIKIDGHTDSDGDETKNLDLSKRRASSVKNMLVSDYSIESSRIETDGYGESKPIGSNSNSEGKAQNRRVEFIKL